MKAHLAATALCALLTALPAAAQQEQPRSMTPSRAEPMPTSSPPADPFKDGGRPESHGGTVHAPQVSPNASLPADMKQTAEDLAQTAITAQQYGNLASKRHTSGVVHELGDKMVITNSRITRALSTVSPDLRNAEQMPAQERASFDTIARDADETQFGAIVAQWVSQSYPKAISALEQLGQQSQFSELAGAALPEMRAQLSDARTILQSASAPPSGQPNATGTITDPKKQSD